MLFEERREPAPELARAVAVNDTHDLLIAHGGLVEELLDAGDRFVHRAADDVDLGQ